MNLLAINLMYVVMDIIHETYTGLPASDHSKLNLLQLRPRSEAFADVPLSASIAPNDVANSRDWRNEEMTWPGSKYNTNSSKDLVEVGGLGGYYNFRYTVDFTLFFQELGLTPDEGLVAAMSIIMRIIHAIMVESERQGGKLAKLRKADDLGFSLFRSSNAVKAWHMIPRGSDQEVLYRGKAWLQFEVEKE
jgi:hypothetical protein